MAKRILIGSPVHQRSDILRLFLASLSRLRQDVMEVSFFFIDDNRERMSSELLERFQELTPRVHLRKSSKEDDYIRSDHTHHWNEQLIWKVAAFKNEIIAFALQEQFDSLFLVDSDLLLDERTLIQLMKADKPIVSEVFWTKWQPHARPQPQVWLRNEYDQWEQGRGEQLTTEQVGERMERFFAQLRIPGLYEVGGLGACTLMDKTALTGGVHFGEIPNVGFWGEDRHFCIRAAALGFPLHVDTHFPAYHIYRDEDLPGARLFMGQNSGQVVVSTFGPDTHPSVSVRPRLTLSMIVRNEAGRYLREALQRHRRYIDDAVIIDDGSTDHTVELIAETLQGIPLKLVRNETPRFSNEVALRKQQWEETLMVRPEWILNLDADEWFEDRFEKELDGLLSQPDVNVYCFRLYDFWSRTAYREDSYWRAHESYRPFLLKYQPGFAYTWRETAQHCGRFPQNIYELPHRLSNLRLKHLGWADSADRQEKWERYRRLDPDAQFGWAEQYGSILDQNPHLLEWVEE
ncbi:glycosyltransferase [Paenibacillus sp. NPDC058071]|uniref:glycosyltransferase n=1 Tax=Paenibacillus sp. NPDC058071 TaxID=3346326 RepID=UPI0036DF8E9D